jgi:hypothetical protein
MFDLAALLGCLLHHPIRTLELPYVAPTAVWSW